MSIVLLLTCRHLRVQNANGILTVPTALWQCQHHLANADGFDLHYTNRGLTSHKESADRHTQPLQGSKEAKRYRAPRLRRGPQSHILSLFLIQGGE